MIYILDTYNKYARNEDVVHTFFICDTEYCIRKVPLEWGEPSFPEKDGGYGEYAIYETYEDALRFVNEIRRLR